MKPDAKALQQLDLNLLKMFVTLYQEQNMTRAAEQLHITPSAVSHGIRRLRMVLGDPLFRRHQHQMVPTPACQRMAPLIRDTLSRLQQILHQWGEFDPATNTHHFNLGMHDALEISLLPRLLKELAVQAPKISLSSIKVARNQITRELAAGHVDMAVDVALPSKPPVYHEKLLDDQLVVMCRPQHPCAGQLSLKTYLACQHVVVSNRPVGLALEDVHLREQGHIRGISLRCQNYHAASEFLTLSDMLLTVPATLAKKLAGDRLTIVPLPFTCAPVTTHLYWHANTNQDAAQRWLREQIKALCRGATDQLIL